MRIAAQFSLSVELMKLPHVQSALTYTVESIINLARALKRSGSDILVEVDLGAIFGRARIAPSVETHFKDVVKIASFVPLHPDCEIILDAGPGPTVLRALKDRHYLATIIQLSFLGWMHETTSLASALVENMKHRFQAGVQGATPDPDYEGILSMLRACLSQTSQYPWETLVALVEHRFPKSYAWFRLQRSPLKRLSPDTLLAAMDYLYLVQSLPEDRFMMIDNQMGLVPMVVWANCILGLRIHVQDSPDGDVVFGEMGNPQVIIKWNRHWQLNDAELLPAPTVYLLDGEMDVVLTTSPDDAEAMQLEGEERHRLEAYGTTFLKRLFNRTRIIADNHAIYQETAQFAIAFAIALSRAMRRIPFPAGEIVAVPPQCCRTTEIWQIKDSSCVIFSGIQLDWPAIENYIDSFTVGNGSWPIPPAVRAYLESTISGTNPDSYVKENFISDIKRVASWILAFAQVVDIKACSQLPLIWDAEWTTTPDIMTWDGQKPIDMKSDIWFSRIIHMLMGQTSGKVTSESSSRLFLISERGWSLYHNNLGDNDPGSVKCELLCIKRGVPTNSRTQERRYQISDAPRIRPPPPPKGPAPCPQIVERSGSYVPRCFTPVVKRTEHYSSRSKDFLLSVRYDITESWPEGMKKYSLYASHRQFHEALWAVVKTEPCSHPHNYRKREELDLGVVTVKGFDWTVESGTENHRVCVCLVMGDSRARWLVVGAMIHDTEEAENVPGGLARRVMLRCDGCCVDCAVKAASSLEGKWLVIL